MAWHGMKIPAEDTRGAAERAVPTGEEAPAGTEQAQGKKVRQWYNRWADHDI